MLVSGGSIYLGSSAITEVYRGSTLVWRNGIPAPDWPDNYFYPDISYSYNSNGLSFWKNSLTSGQTYSINVTRTDDEGEGGGGFYAIQPQSGNGQFKENERYSTDSIVPNKNYQNAWVHIYDEYTAIFNDFGDFNGGTAIAYKSVQSYGGNGCHLPATGTNWNNVVLAISLIPGNNNSHNSHFNGIVQNCPNLKYICLNIDGSNTGSTIGLTGSTAWTADSMKFTEWYCPGTTFIVQDNSWWRSRIDWDIAEVRNVTFMDTNSNIMTRS